MELTVGSIYIDIGPTVLLCKINEFYLIVRSINNKILIIGAFLVI